jgi:hypothetical protein
MDRVRDRDSKTEGDRDRNRERDEDRKGTGAGVGKEAAVGIEGRRRPFYLQNLAPPLYALCEHKIAVPLVQNNIYLSSHKLWPTDYFCL